MKFICNKCNYRFESKENRAGKQCPYCGKNEVIREPNAQELIKFSE